MLAWGKSLSECELDSLVAYVRTLGPKAEGSQKSADIRARLERLGFRAAARTETAPAVLVTDTEGRRHSLEEFQGKMVLVAFWGVTCVPCLDEMPDLERLAEDLRGRGLVVLSVCVDEADLDRVREVAGQRAKRLPVYVDANGSTKLRFDVQALPTAVLIGPSGQLLGRAEGSRHWTEEEFETLIDTITTPDNRPRPAPTDDRAPETKGTR
jgi:thiol-disulfide isomerase/thioredoxin